MAMNILRKYSPDECAERRRQVLHELVAPKVARALATFPALESAVLFVGQYWCDEALDAVHGDLRYSVSENPDVQTFLAETMKYEISVDALIEGPDAEQALGGVWDDDRRLAFRLEYCSPRWDSNGEAIPLFAAYCREGAHQEMPLGEACAPYCIFRRAKPPSASSVDVEIVGEQIRLWLEGVMPQSGGC